MMVVERMIVSGIVRNGVVVPEGPIRLPEGLCVEILAPEVPADLQVEFEAWEAASDEDFATFEAMLQEGDPSA